MPIESKIEWHPTHIDFIHSFLACGSRYGGGGNANCLAGPVTGALFTDRDPFPTQVRSTLAGDRGGSPNRLLSHPSRPEDSGHTAHPFFWPRLRWSWMHVPQWDRSASGLRLRDY